MVMYTIILELGRLRQEVCQNFEASLSYIMMRPYLKEKKKKQQELIYQAS